MSLNELDLNESAKALNDNLKIALDKIEKKEFTKEDFIGVLTEYKNNFKKAVDVDNQKKIDDLTDHLIDDVKIYKNLPLQIPNIKDSLIGNLSEEK
ncbi:MAG: hypothetical protein WCH65_03935 [bacterium]